ncbi:MAG: DUF4190 domain-containing protein [Bacillota bacterium]
MSELEQQTPSADPIASLRRMSTTAGVGAQDYVAINNLAIATAVLGLTTAFAFMGVLFLIIAVVAIVFGVVALRQIRNSNGTQSGRVFAWFGILLAVGISSYVVAGEYCQRRAELVDARQATAAVDELSRLIVAGDYTAAYNSLDSGFTSEWTLAQFDSFWKRSRDPESRTGLIKKMYGNGLVQFSSLADGSRFAYTKMVIEFTKASDIGRIVVALKKGSDGQWRVISLEPFEKQPTAPRRK